MDAVAMAAPDGYTIGFSAIATDALNPDDYKSMAFDPRKDLVGISLLGYSPSCSKSAQTRQSKPLPTSSALRR